MTRLSADLAIVAGAAALVALLPISANARESIRSLAVQPLLKDEGRLDAMCRGAAALDPKGACRERKAVEQALFRQGFCYGRAQAHEKSAWYYCGGTGGVR